MSVAIAHTIAQIHSFCARYLYAFLITAGPFRTSVITAANRPWADPPTASEIRHLLAARLYQSRPPGHAYHWVNWHRHRQAAHAGSTSAYG